MFYDRTGSVPNVAFHASTICPCTVGCLCFGKDCTVLKLDFHTSTNCPGTVGYLCFGAGLYSS